MTTKELATIFTQIALDEVNKGIKSRPVFFSIRNGVSYPILEATVENLGTTGEVTLLSWRWGNEPARCDEAPNDGSIGDGTGPRATIMDA